MSRYEKAVERRLAKNIFLFLIINLNGAQN